MAASAELIGPAQLAVEVERPRECSSSAPQEDQLCRDTAKWKETPLDKVTNEMFGKIATYVEAKLLSKCRFFFFNASSSETV